MGFKQREKRRKANVAKDRAQTLARNGGSAAPKWWLTIVKVDTCCARCATILRAGREMVYRHEPREALCHRCADRERLPYKPSLAWERETQKRNKRNAQRSLLDRAA